LVFAFNAAKMFGISEQVLSWAAIAVIPIFAWEVTLAIRLIGKGFNLSARFVSQSPNLSISNL
jgi:hypothetical protein